MLECANCGASGEANFSTNYFGELVCELCGTQSFQQARNETQDVDDMAMDASRVSRTHKRASRRRKRDPEAAEARRREREQRRARHMTTDVALLDCLVATQRVLEHMVRAVMTRVGGFPPEYPRVVRDLWFQLLESWESKSERPFLRCYTEYFIRHAVVKGEDGDALDHAMTQDLLAQWDAERPQTDNEGAGEAQDPEEGVVYGLGNLPPRVIPPGYYMDGRQMRAKYPDAERVARTRTLKRVGIVDLPPLMWLAARMLNLPLLPRDFTIWMLTGVIPYSNLLETCCEPELRARVADVSLFFETSLRRNKVSTAKFIYQAHCLQANMELRLPPLNAPLVAYTIIENLGLPPLVSRNFQWITALMNGQGDLPEAPLITFSSGVLNQTILADLTPRMLDTGVGIAAHLLVAIKMCPNWFDWIFQRVSDDTREHASQDRQVRLDVADAVRFGEAVPSLPRRHFAAFMAYCEHALVDPERKGIPEAFAKHAMKLQTLEPSARSSSRDSRRQSIESGGSLRPHELRTYPPLYEDGICIETDDDMEARLEKYRVAKTETRQYHDDGDSDDADEDEMKSGSSPDRLSEASVDGQDEVEAYFYPIYDDRDLMGHAMHPVFENVLEMVCEYLDVPMATVLRVVKDLDRRLETLCERVAKRAYRKKKKEVDPTDQLANPSQ